MAETEYKQRNSSSGRKNKSDEILKKFAGMMVKIIKKANANNWKKGWMGVNGSIQGATAKYQRSDLFRWQLFLPYVQYS